jgi:asparagine synthase (glutamine-hydrolysing)
MCGIAGYLGLHPGEGGPVLARMARQLVPRGPDGQGEVVLAESGLVHRRLATMDGGDGAQPLHSLDRRWVLGYDGELYNHDELREELTSLGHDANTEGDVGLVLAAWEQWGIAAFDRFHGAFALALADTVTGEVVLARDQFGIRPLYLAPDGSGRVVFGSEIRAVLAAAIVPRRADDVTVYRYLRYGVHDDTERTFFAGVSRLLPGEVATIAADGTVRRESYSRLRHELDWLAAAPRPYDSRARDQVYAALVAAVRRRLGGDTPIGTVLSGDLPEATVAGVVDRLLAANDPQAAVVCPEPQAFAAIVQDKPSRDGDRERDRERDVDAVARALGRPPTVHKVRPDTDGLLDDLTDFIRTQEEPVTSPAPYLHYRLMRDAGRRVAVVLESLGADEVFAGDPAHHRVHLRDLIRRRRYVAAAIEAVLHPAQQWRSAQWWRSARRWLAGRVGGARPVAPEQVLDHRFATTHAAAHPAAHASGHLDVATADLKRRLADDIFQHRLPALLRSGDRNRTRFSVEGRTPFLDPPLLRLLWGLDNAALISGGRGRRALRDSTARLLPARIRRRQLQPTGPEQAWLGRMKDVVLEVLSSDTFAARPYIDQAAAMAASRAHLTGPPDPDTAALLWRLVNLELWLRRCVEDDPTVPLAAAALVGIRPGRQRTSGAAPPGLRDPDSAVRERMPAVTPDGRWAHCPLGVDPAAHHRDGVATVAGARAAGFFTDLLDAPPEMVAAVEGNRWYLFCDAPATVMDAELGGAAQRVSAAVRAAAPAEARRRFGGTVVIDTSIRGRAVRGHDTDLSSDDLATVLADHPPGQRRDGTSLAVAVVVALDQPVVAGAGGSTVAPGPAA